MENLIKELKEKMYAYNVYDVDEYINLTKAMRNAKFFEPKKDMYDKYIIADDTDFNYVINKNRVVLYEEIVNNYKENACIYYFKKLTCYFDYESYTENEDYKINRPNFADFDAKLTNYIWWEESYLKCDDVAYDDIMVDY